MQTKMKPMPLLKKFGPVFFSGLILLVVIIRVPPPQNLSQASPFQLLFLFLPLVVFLISLSNLFFPYLPQSLIISLGVFLLLILQGLAFLNLPILIGVIILVIILLKLIKKPRKVYIQKIPQISHLKKQR